MVELPKQARELEQRLRTGKLGIERLEHLILAIKSLPFCWKFMFDSRRDHTHIVQYLLPIQHLRACTVGTGPAWQAIHILGQLNREPAQCIYRVDKDPLPDTNGVIRHKAEIVIQHLPDAVYVPVQAVLRVKGETTVFVLEGKEAVPRRVGTGLDNNRMIHITEGVNAGELVLLNPPLAAGTVEKRADDGGLPQRPERRRPRSGPQSPESDKTNKQRG